jgi:hypothetical protein
MRHSIMAASMWVALSCFPLSGQARANCVNDEHYEQQDGLGGWPTRVENSSDATLRTAYTQGTCRYLKGEHGGGTIPAGATSDRHVTVSRAGVTCHVFKKSANSRSTYFPTTCF